MSDEIIMAWSRLMATWRELQEKEESTECPLCETGYEHNHEKEEAK